MTRRRLADGSEERAHLVAQALEAVLERLPGAALVVSEQGRVHRANESAWERLAEDRVGFACALAQSLAGAADAPFECVPLEGTNHALVIERIAGGSTRPLAALFGRRFRLSAAETRVLERVALGQSNRAIAAALGNSERTVESHVARLLQKCGCTSRAALVAAFWTVA